ncbi:hypothetical protein Talka_00019 [Tepidimonas alkaliphilus]|uniref:PsiF repeat protein n=1 Tax=Tepidimonas alkaliphilus TaxID=2588942 RepID=A0A554WCP4_9BURK|nr:hypothetical protein [Tepidimonas alkaliphilus]TSE21352.1 hypothetical protein Talka_00019 [Tepidimonas alkaliphilus]
MNHQGVRRLGAGAGLACAALTLAHAAWAAEGALSACEAAAQERKLAGAAKTSFVKKCQQEAQTRCEAQAGEKKLAGAARASFVTKCVRETGPQGQ